MSNILLKTCTLIACISCSLFISSATVDPVQDRINHVTYINENASCKISPDIKVLLSIPQDRDYDTKYITDDPQILHIQCLRDIPMDIYLQTPTGIIKTQTDFPTTYPACQETLKRFTNLMGDDGKRYFKKELLVPGTFISIPIVVDDNYNILVGDFGLTRKAITESLPPYMDVSGIEECQPNIRLNK